MNAQKRRVVWLGLCGLILIILGIKYMSVFLAVVNQQTSIGDRPAVLFFNVNEPCDCMVELTERAEQQMANWPADRRDGLSVVRIAMEQRLDLEAKYKVFRAPCLVLVDEQGQVAWRQDYPLIEGGPFKLEELEAAIAKLGLK
jgi:hypothetical protein